MNKLQFDFNHQNFSVTLPDEASRSVWTEIFKEREYKAAEATIISAQGQLLMWDRILVCLCCTLER